MIATRTKRPTLVETLLDWRTEYRFGIAEGIVLSAYCAILAFTIPFHEPWGDEAQAWLIARDSTTWTLLRNRLHYEGAPPLWHLALHLIQWLGAPYAGMNWLGGVFAVAGVFVLLRWSPFPLLLRFLLPFTFFLQYQYAVVARGYTLFPLLVFALCALFPRRHRLVAFAVVAGLLANLSMQGAVFSIVAIALYGWQHFRSREGVRGKVVPHRLATALLAYVVLVICAALVAVPAPDDNFFAVGNQVATGPVHDLLVRYIGQPTAKLPFLPQPFVPELPRPKVDFLKSPGGWAIWYITCDERAPGCPHDTFYGKPVLLHVINGANQVTWPISTSKILACLFLLALLLWLSAMHCLRFLLFGGALLVFGQILWSVDHHSGMFVVSLLAAMWLARSCGPAPEKHIRLDQAFVVLSVVVFALQIGWTVHCVRSDIQEAYDPGRAAAAYLKQHPPGRMAAFQYFSTSIQPYFAHNPFFNLPSSYWLWSTVDNPDAHYHETIASHPDLVVFSIDLVRPGIMENEWAPMLQGLSPVEERSLMRNPIVSDLYANGYQETHRFCGSRFMRLGTSMGVCDVFFEPDAKITGVSQRAPDGSIPLAVPSRSR